MDIYMYYVFKQSYLYIDTFLLFFYSISSIAYIEISTYF